ncbi:hypothetical protein [Polaromonas jejuensis]|uniref:Twin-arginine translocation signal domain-containing protein n=1 Tax=Polaromonas jejuensis TaxID=457502 RepID=A0ABW0QF57_9BURK
MNAQHTIPANRANRRDLIKTGLALAAGGVRAQWMPSLRYPDPAVVILDPSFAKYRLFSASVEQLVTGFRGMEGPVRIGDGPDHPVRESSPTSVNALTLSILSVHPH